MNGNGHMIDAEVIKPVVLVEKKSSQVDDPQQKMGVGKYIDPPYDLEQLVKFYEENTWHFRCCNLKAQVVTGLGFNIYPLSEDQKEDDEYERLKLFLDHPNPEETIFEILNKFWIDYESQGNAYLEVVRNRGGEVTEIYHVPAYTVRRAQDKPGYYQVRSGNSVYLKRFGDEEDDAESEIIHLKSYYPKSDYYGMPDFLPALFAAVLDRHANTFNQSFFDNNAIPAMVMVVKGGSLSENAKNTIANFFTSQLKGSDKAHRLLQISVENPDVEIDFEKLMVEIKEASFLDLRRMNRDEIIAAHGVPPRLLGVMSAGQLGGKSEAFAQMQIFKETVINPRQRRLEHMMNRLARIGLGIENWRIKFTEFDSSSMAEDAEFVKKMVEIGVLTVNEGRELLGYEPLDNPPPNLKQIEELLNRVKKSLEDA